VSQLTARDVRSFFHVPAARITVVANGLDHERFRPGSPEKARQTTSELRGITAPFFLYVARLEHPAKNHVRLNRGVRPFQAATARPGNSCSGQRLARRFGRP